jgi:hypothetical protein
MCEDYLVIVTLRNMSMYIILLFRVLDRTLNCPGGVLADIEGRSPPFVAVHVDTTHVIVPGF